MDLNDMGQLHAFLLRYRSIDSRPRNRKLRSGESELANILIAAGSEGLAQINQFLLGQGLELIEFTDTDMPGILTGARVWVLARSPEASPPPFFSIEQVMARMKLRDDSREAAAIWYLHIWLIHLALLYSVKGRAVSAVSGYLDSAFEEQALVRAVREHIERVRSAGLQTDLEAQDDTEGDTGKRDGTDPDQAAERRVYRILSDERGSDIARRVRSFLELMLDAGLLSRSDTGIYEQTLLGAVELSQGFNRSLQHIMPDDDALTSIINLAAPIAEPGNDQAEDALHPANGEHADSEARA